VVARLKRNHPAVPAVLRHLLTRVGHLKVDRRQRPTASTLTACPSRPPWTNHPPTVRACGWPLQGPWLDHRSPATAYGLTRCACRTALFVGFGAIQWKPKPWISSGQSRCLLWSSGPAPQAAGHGPAPSGPGPEERDAVRQRPVGQSAISRRARPQSALHA